jgi:hypothetical protein
VGENFNHIRYAEDSMLLWRIVSKMHELGGTVVRRKTE